MTTIGTNLSQSQSKYSQVKLQPNNAGKNFLTTGRGDNNESMLYKMAYYTAQGVIFLPKKILQTSSFMIGSLLNDEYSKTENQVTKVRPPRFVSFTLELEPYSKKKAFALEILNEINLNVFEAETIQKLYTMSQHVVIITGKRIICVDEVRPSNIRNTIKPEQIDLIHSQDKETDVGKAGQGSQASQG
jgi:hypothetical protein